MIHKLNFITTYNQFYLADKLHQGSSGSDNFWTNEAHSDRLANEKGILGIRTESYGDIKGELVILDKPPVNDDIDKCDHVVEAGLEISSGTLQVLDCPNNNVEISLNVSPGKYRVRVYCSNFESVKETDFADDADDDYYKILLWKSDDMERKVLKQSNR